LSRFKDTSKQSPAVDPWGGSSTTTTNGGNEWAKFADAHDTSSPFSATTEWPTTTVSNENLSAG
jgi:hypothetical protein